MYLIICAVHPGKCLLCKHYITLTKVVSWYGYRAYMTVPYLRYVVSHLVYPGVVNMRLLKCFLFSLYYRLEETKLTWLCVVTLTVQVQYNNV